MSDAKHWRAKAERARRLIAAGYDSVTEQRLRAAAAEFERMAVIAKAAEAPTHSEPDSK